jgi:hypothetical protein
MAAKKATKEELERRAAAAALASQGQYNFVIPCLNADYAYIKEIDSIRRPHLSTSSERFLKIVKDYQSKGQLERIVSEMTEFSKTEPRWNAVIEKVLAHCSEEQQ